MAEAAAEADGTQRLNPLSLDLQLCFSLYTAANLMTRVYRPLLQPLGQPGLPAAEGREDDEICETIRSLQSQLKQQIKVNNGLKAELRPLVEKRMELQAKEEETKKEWAVALARYDQLMSNKRKK